MKRRASFLTRFMKGEVPPPRYFVDGVEYPTLEAAKAACAEHQVVVTL